jgi:hypothetical protein
MLCPKGELEHGRLERLMFDESRVNRGKMSRGTVRRGNMARERVRRGRHKGDKEGLARVASPRRWSPPSLATHENRKEEMREF